MITGNNANDGGGVYGDTFDNGSQLTFENNTIASNNAATNGGVYFSADTGTIFTLLNSIVYSYNPSGSSFSGSGTLAITYSDIQGYTGGGTGNLDPPADPLFLGDYHLGAGSQCINKGNPAAQYKDPDGSRNDMGAYGGPGGGTVGP